MGDRSKRDIHGGIAEWHDAHPDGVSLHAFLGLTLKQYSLWVDGGPLPKGSPWYDGARHRARQGQTKEERARLKLARRRAQGELAARYRSEYQSLLAKHMKALEGVERDLLAGDNGEDEAGAGLAAAAGAGDAAGGPEAGLRGDPGEGGPGHGVEAGEAAAAAAGAEAVAAEASGGVRGAAGADPS